MAERSSSSRQPLQVIVGAPALRSLISSSRGTALILLELGGTALFAGGVAERMIGQAAPLFLLAAVVLGWALRSVDLESSALFIPGGLYGTATQAYGRATGRLAASALLIETLIFGALTASAAGHSLAALGGFVPRAFGSSQITVDDVSTAAAVVLIGAVWLWLRQGRPLSSALITRTVGYAVAALVVIVAWGVVRSVPRHDASRWVAALATTPFSIVPALTAAGLCLFAVGTAQTLGRASLDFPQPKIQHLRRVARFVNAYSLVTTAVIGILFVWLVPAGDRAAWRDAPVAGLVFSAGGAGAVRRLVRAGVLLGSALFLTMAIYRSAANIHQLLLRLTEDGLLSRAMRAPHPRFGTPSRMIDFAAVASLAVLIAGAGQLALLASAYGMALACSAILKIASLIRLRKLRPEPRAFRVPMNVRFAGLERPLGLVLIAILLAVPALALVATGNPAALAVVVVLVVLTALLGASDRAAQRSSTAEAAAPPEIELLTMPAIGFDRMEVRPRNLLVPIRRAGVLNHLVAAVQEPGDRDVVVMTVRLVGIDVSEDLAFKPEPTDDERRLLTAAAVLAERYGRAIRLLIVPSANVFDALAETIVRLRSSVVYVGESETLSADDQARLLGDAWERADKPEPFDVRLVIHHSSGRTAFYDLGAHAPSLSLDDLHLIHAIWLDAVKTVGPHVHHRDIVRAALTNMQEQLKNDGPARDAALDLVGRTAHPADELAALVHERDFARLRDVVRNRPPSDLAAVLTELSVEDQVVTFRVLPRKLAAATFEYLSHDAQQTLLTAMAQEDVAAILNDMAPDDRTTFLEELPATATQQLLALLTPEERAVAVTLLGYPEKSIGRLMTPDYIAVREQWTVQEVLEYVRTHGQDSETLNVIYVVDDHGVLIDDIRIREFLLTSPASHVADLMDRRFAALNASDEQDNAVTIFRRDDRSALPVTDSAGVLIGIVTIDDVLDVAEAAATNEIQRIGGSEALDEPYMRIAFPRMIQKRAGWLTALFLGEMLTATAMGAFEREIERAVVLALFVPLIISSGGNSGSQASTLVIRAIALGEVMLSDWWRVMRREVAAGLTLGSILGTIGFLRITIWSAFSNLYGPHWLLVAVTVGLALVGVVLWGTLIGSLLPFVLRRLGFDPAASSAPFVATLVDVTGLVIYFSVGILVLRGTLL